MSVIAWIAACAGGVGAPVPLLEGDGFLDRPWPDDARTVDGHPELSGWPGSDEVELVARYLELEGELDGFGLTTPAFVRFDRAIDVDRLPDPAGSTDPRTAAVFLLDVDRDSPERGRAVPLEFEWRDEETGWTPANLLAAKPVWGAVLRPRTTYALVVTTDIAAAPEGFAERWSPGRPDHEAWAEVQEALLEAGVDVGRVALAVRFTTGDPTAEMAAIARATREELEVPRTDPALRAYTPSTGTYAAWEGRLRVPVWQHGEPPYSSEGGGFVFGADGTPVLAGWEEVRFVLSVPVGVDAPASGWPVVVYGHGTGGWAGIFADDADEGEPATQLARAGLAGFGISLPFHGDRNDDMGDPALLSFNWLNPEAARCNFRQAAAEQLYLLHLLSARAREFSTPEGETIRLDPDRVAYLGHSHGGEVGAIAAPFAAPEARAVVLSGTGGGLALSLLHREADDYDILGIVEAATGVPADELDDTHPLVVLLQLLGEATDPLVYAPGWWGRPLAEEAEPVSVLEFEGTEDAYAPPVAHEALAGAAGQPFLEEAVQRSGLLAVEEPFVVEPPAEGTAEAWDGGRVASALAQYEGLGHFVIFDVPSARLLYRTFLATAMEGTPELRER